MSDMKILSVASNTYFPSKIKHQWQQSAANLCFAFHNNGFTVSTSRKQPLRVFMLQNAANHVYTYLMIS